MTLDYDNANQPFAAGDYVAIQFSRDQTNDTYTQDVYVFGLQLAYTSNTLAVP